MDVDVKHAKWWRANMSDKALTSVVFMFVHHFVQTGLGMQIFKLIKISCMCVIKFRPLWQEIRLFITSQKPGLQTTLEGGRDNRRKKIIL